MLGPRVQYRRAPDAPTLHFRPSPLRETWRYLSRHAAATVPALIEATGITKKTVESHLWHFRQMGLVVEEAISGGRTGLHA